MNKLFVCRSTAENIKRCEEYRFFKANDLYCLVITDETPEAMAEVDETAAKDLTRQDWAWISAVGDTIKAEAEYARFQTETQNFLRRFEEELIREKEGSDHAGDPDGGGTGE